jgi:hypothetical protein
MKLVLKEEERMANQRAYRTPARTLRKLAEGPMIFELDKTRSGDWDRFQVRSVGVRAQPSLAKQYGSDADRMRKEAVGFVARALNARADQWPGKTVTDLAVALSLIPDLDKWANTEKRLLLKVIQAKSSADESDYLKLMQRHDRLRTAIIELGRDVVL